MQSYLHKRHMAIIQAMEKKKTRITVEKRKVWSVGSTSPPSPHTAQCCCAIPNILGEGREGRMWNMGKGVAMQCNRMHRCISEVSRPIGQVLSHARYVNCMQLHFCCAYGASSSPWTKLCSGLSPCPPPHYELFPSHRTLCIPSSYLSDKLLGLFSHTLSRLLPPQ